MPVPYYKHNTKSPQGLMTQVLQPKVVTRVAVDFTQQLELSKRIVGS